MNDTPKLNSDFKDYELFNRAVELTEEIRTHQINNLTFFEEIAVIERRVEDMKDHIVIRIMNAKGDDGKNLYTNETARQAAKRKELVESLDYQGNLKTLRNLKQRKELNSFEIQLRKTRVRLIIAYLSKGE